MCRKAAQEVKEAGGVNVKGKRYQFECIACDNKATSAEGAHARRSDP